MLTSDLCWSRGTDSAAEMIVTTRYAVAATTIQRLGCSFSQLASLLE